MKSYLDISTIYIKEQKKRTFVTCLGIILSIALITTICIFNTSVKNNKIKQVKDLYGSYHAEIKEINKEQLRILKKHLTIEKIGIKKNLVKSRISDEWIAADIGNYDKNLRDMLNIELIAGRLPKDEKEIVLEHWIVSKLHLEYRLDENIILNFIDNNNKENFTVYNKLPERFKLVGILKNSEQVKPVITTKGLVSNSTVYSLINTEKDITYDVYIEVNHNLPIRQTIEEIRQNIGIKKEKIIYNNNFIEAIGNRHSISFVEVFLIFIVLLVSILAIYNVFNISIFERIKEFGILRALGTTSDQVRKIVFKEALFLSMVSIPIGVILGILFVKGLVIRFSYFKSIVNNVNLEPKILILIIFISIIAIFLAALGPAVMVVRFPIAEAIKINSKILYENDLKRRNYNGTISKMFGISGQIAYQNIWRNRKRAKITIFSMSIGVVLFILLSSFIYCFNPSKLAENYGFTDYTIKGFSSLGYTSKEYSKIASLEGVENIYASRYSPFYMRLKGDETTENKTEENFEYFYDNNIEGEFISGTLYGYDDKTLKLAREHLLKGKIDNIEMSRMLTVIVTEEFYLYNPNIKIGDNIKITIDQRGKEGIEYITLNCKVGGIVSKIPFEDSAKKEGPSIIVHEYIYKRYRRSLEYNRFDIKAKQNANFEKLKGELGSIAKSVPEGDVISLKDKVNQYEKYKKQISILTISLIIVIIGIGIFNIMNSISVNLALRIRELSIFRALGMTRFQLRKSIMLEGAFYGIISSILGGITGIISTKFSFVIIRTFFPYIVWEISDKVVIISSLGCVLISLLAVILPLRNLSKISIVDCIRNLE